MAYITPAWYIYGIYQMAYITPDGLDLKPLIYELLVSLEKSAGCPFHCRETACVVYFT